MPAETTTVRGREVTVEPVRQLEGGGARVDVEAADGRRWRLDVPRSGTDPELVTSWRDGQLADLQVPDWIDDVLLRLQAA
jgi:hypothetical protein